MKLNELTFELDEHKGSILNSVETINDISNELGFLRQDLDNKSQKEIKLSMDRIHRKIRIMDSLLRHTTRGLIGDVEKISNISEELFHEVRGQDHE